MTWLSAALATVGFCLYFVALTLQSTSLRRMRFARVANLALLRRRVPRRFRGRVCALLLALSLILMGFAVWHSINVGRSVFILLASFGVILIAIRLLGFLFTHISLIALEIDTDPGSSTFSLAHLRRSPFILGGLALVVLGIGYRRCSTAFCGRGSSRIAASSGKHWRLTPNAAGFGRITGPALS